MNKMFRFEYIFGGIFLGIGLVFLFAGIAILSFQTQISLEDTVIAGTVFTSIGSVFSLIGMPFILYGMCKKRKIRRLMNEGICYNAEIIQMRYNYFMSVNHNFPLIVECSYKDKYGKINLVKSGNLWLRQVPTMENKMKSTVYVNPDDPTDYFVDVFIDQKELLYDNDYR